MILSKKGKFGIFGIFGLISKINDFYAFKLIMDLIKFKRVFW